MMPDIRYVLLFLLSVFLSSVSQIILKKSAGKSHGSFIQEYLNPPVIIAYGIFFCSSLMTVLAYRSVPLSMGAVLEATGYIWVTILGVLFLKEKLNLRKFIGLGCIITGIVLFSL